jgi:hypothetical protein
MKVYKIPGFGSGEIDDTVIIRLEENGRLVVFATEDPAISVNAGVYNFERDPTNEQVTDLMVGEIQRFLESIESIVLPASIERIEAVQPCCAAVQAVAKMKQGHGVWLVCSIHCPTHHGKSEFTLLSTHGDVEKIKANSFPIIYGYTPHPDIEK